MSIDHPVPSDPNAKGTRKGLVPGTLDGDPRPINPGTGEREGGLDDNYLDAGKERQDHKPVAELSPEEAETRDGGPARVETASGRVVTRDEVGLHGDIPNPDAAPPQEGPDATGSEADEPAVEVAEGPVSAEIGDLDDELDAGDLEGDNENIPDEQ